MDYDALFDALSNKVIGGALLDEFPGGCWVGPEMDCGPPFGSHTFPFNTSKDFRTLDNVVMTPLMMMQPTQFWDLSAAFAATNVHALQTGAPMAGVVRNASVTTRN